MNLEINVYHTATQLIFHENDVYLLQAFDNTTCDRSSEIQTRNKKKNEIDCVILIVFDVNQFDRLEERKEDFLIL